MNWADYFYIDTNHYNALRWKVSKGRSKANSIVDLNKDVTIDGKKYNAQDVWYELNYNVSLISEKHSFLCEEKDVYNQQDENNIVVANGVSYNKRSNSWVARWYEDGKQLQRSFSCNKYSDAYERAVEYRNKQDSYALWR